VTAHETERLSAWLDGELPPEDRRVVEAHLEGCPECRSRVAALRAADEAARELPAEAPEGYFDDFAARVRARIAEEPTRRPFPHPRRVPWPVWAGALAAALVLAVVVPRTLERAPAPDLEQTLPSRVTGAAETAAPPAPSPAPAAPVVADSAREVSSEAGTPLHNEVRREKKEARPVVPGGPARQATEAPAASPPAQPGGSGPAERRAEGFAVAPAPRADEESMDRTRDEALLERDQPRPAAAPAPRAKGSEPRSRTLESGAAAPVAAPAAPAPTTLAQGAVSALEADEGAYRQLLATTPADAAGWRGLRDAWSAFAAAHPSSPHADEARVRAIEAGVAAWRVGGQATDLERAEDDLAAYLGRDDARQKDRARRALEGTGTR